MTVDNPDPNKLYPMFLYGTLRPGQLLWPWIKDSVVGNAHVGYAPGFRLYASESGTYPYMVKANLAPAATSYGVERIVRGTLVHVKWTDTVGEIVTMEVQSGYALEQVPIRFKPLGDVVGLANTFVYPEKFIYSRINPLCDWTNIDDKPSAMLFDWAHHLKNHKLPGAEEIESIPRITS